MSVVSAVIAIENFDATDEFMELQAENDSENSTEDEGIECVSEVPASPADSQTTPEVSSSLCDSGFADVDPFSGLDFKCLECLLEWPSKEAHAQCDDGECKSDVLPEHSGFEDYVDDIYLHRLSIEDKYHAPACLDNQPELSPAVRGSLVQWMTAIHREFKLCQDTLYLSVNILDRVLDVMQVSRDCIELLGITCLLVASKQNEIIPPEISDLVVKCTEQYTRDQVRQLEMIVLMATSFDLLAPTAQQFLEYFASYCMTAAAADGEHIYRLKIGRAVSRCLLDLSLQEYEFCQFKPSLLALCIWKAALEYLETGDGSYFPAGMCINRAQYDLCKADVHLFIDSVRQICPDMNSLYIKFASLYRSK